MNRLRVISGYFLGLFTLVFSVLTGPSAQALNSSSDYFRLGPSRALSVDSGLSSGVLEIGYAEALHLLTRFFHGQLHSPSSELSDAQIILRAALKQGIFSSRFANATLRVGMHQVLKIGELKNEFIRLQREERGSPLAGMEGRLMDQFLLYFRMWVHVHQYNNFESESGDLANEARYFLVRINTALENAKVGTPEQKKAYLDQLLVFAVLSVVPTAVTDANAEWVEKIKTSALDFVRSLENPAVMGPILGEADRRENARSKAAMKWGAIVGGVGFNLVRLALSAIHPRSTSFMASFGDPLWAQGTVTAGCAALGSLGGALLLRFFGTAILCSDLDRFAKAGDACLTALGGIHDQTSFDLVVPPAPPGAPVSEPGASLATGTEN